MRYVAFHVELGREPWVMAEGPDETFMRDLPHHVWYKAVVLSELEAELDPDFAPALAAWRAGDDSVYDAWDAVELAEMALDDARIELIGEGAIERPEPTEVTALEAFTFVEDSDPDAECERLFKTILGSLVAAEITFGEERAVRLWRAVAHYCKDAAERNHHPKLV